MPQTETEILDANVRYHDLAATHYDSKWGIGYDEVGQAQVTGKLRKALGREPGRYPRALEIGAGTGYFTLNLLRAGVIGEAVATDISPGMLRALERSARELGSQVETVACEASALPFEDGSFDLVFGHAVLHHLPDLDAAFREFRRVLRPGGMIAFCGEPSRYGDRLAAVPEARRPSSFAALADADGRLRTPQRERRVRLDRGGTARAARGRSRLHTGGAVGARRARGPRGRARERRGAGGLPASAGPTGPSRRARSRTRSPGPGASMPIVGTSCFRGWTARCWSRACPLRSSTTCSSRPAHPDKENQVKPPIPRGSLLGRLAAIAALLALVALLASCGGDDDDDGGGGGGDTASFCDEVKSILASDNGEGQAAEQQAKRFQEAIDRLQKVDPPEEIAEDWNMVMKAWRAEDESEVDLEATQKSGKAVQKYVSGECGITEENSG